MSRIAKILSFIRLKRNDANVTDVKIDIGGGENVTSEHFSSPGDDSNPLITDYAIATSVTKTGSLAIVGYLDPINEAKTLPGEKRIYSRDEDQGAVKSELWMKQDGSVLISNENGSLFLQPDGKVIINGVEIDVDGNITTTKTIKADTVDASNSLVASGKEIVNHDHDIAWTDPAGQGTSGTNN